MVDETPREAHVSEIVIMESSIILVVFQLLWKRTCGVILSVFYRVVSDVVSDVIYLLPLEWSWYLNKYYHKNDAELDWGLARTLYRSFEQEMWVTKRKYCGSASI